MNLEKVVISTRDTYEDAGNKILNLLYSDNIPNNLTFKEFRDSYVVFPSEEYKQKFLLYWKNKKTQADKERLRALEDLMEADVSRREQEYGRDSWTVGFSSMNAKEYKK